MKTWKENISSWSEIGNIVFKKATVIFSDEDNTVFHNDKIGKQFTFSEYHNKKVLHYLNCLMILS